MPRGLILPITLDTASATQRSETTIMADMRYDIQFAGELLDGADSGAARERLRDLFKLSPQALDRLFSGRPAVIKRDLDAAGAARYRAAFREAGALLHIVPAAASQHSQAPNPLSATGPAVPSGLTLAPPGTQVGEAPPPGPRDIDTTHLSLIGGADWTLADCDRPPPPMPIPDLSHLALVPMEPAHRRPPSAFDE
jgi:hypothetical protein